MSEIAIGDHLIATGNLSVLMPTSAGNWGDAPARHERRWPDLPAAPFSEVQALAVAWLKGGNWSAVIPLLDELQGSGRYDDVREIRATVAMRAAQLFGSFPASLADSWRASAIRVLWFDLFDLPATLAAIEGATK